MSTSHLKLPLPDDDPDALRILLNMIHGHAYRLPQEVAFCTLADIAVLVDKYALHEIAEVYCRFWVEEARVQAMVILSMPEFLPQWLDNLLGIRSEERFSEGDSGYPERCSGIVAIRRMHSSR